MTATQPQAASDIDLVRLAQAGDADAFGELVERNRRVVFRAALAAVGTPAEADDVAQEAFVAAYQKLHSFRGDAAFRTWLLAITWRKAIDRRKSVTRWLKRTVTSFDAQGEEIGDPIDRLTDIPMTDDRIDKAIDRAVQEMLGAEPPPGFAARVRSRLEARRRRPLVWPALASTAAVAAMIVFFVMSRPPSGVSPTPPAVQSAARVTAPEAQKPQPPSPSRTVPRGPVATAVKRAVPAGRDSAALPPFESDVAISPLEPVGSIDVTTVSVEALASPDIAVESLPPIAPLNVQPLPQPGGRE
ncbi:MAG: sigma-70 family RNA polymerase sigma factor [Acidobacteria bacterium]|nr:sigma-70 family RNA polymerase sigma factor [Acidobacteriota bacterium]